MKRAGIRFVRLVGVAISSSSSETKIALLSLLRLSGTVSEGELKKSIFEASKSLPSGPMAQLSLAARGGVWGAWGDMVARRKPRELLDKSTT